MRERVSRQRYAVVLALLVLVAVVLLPGIARRGIAGQPVATVVAGPPPVGSCISAIDGIDITTDATTITSDTFDYPTVTVGSCSGTMVAEVAMVRENVDLPKVTSDQTYTAMSIACSTAAETYVGLTDLARKGADPADPKPSWSPASSIRGLSFGPTPRQRSAGQRWAGCLFAATDSAYRGSLRQRLPAGRLPDQFGSCWSTGVGAFGTDLAGNAIDSQVPCDENHLAQIVGIANAPGLAGVAAATSAKTCRLFAATMTGGPDPTFGGRLRLVSRIPSNGADDGECLLVAPDGHPLNGSLLTIGANALPFSR